MGEISSAARAVWRDGVGAAWPICLGYVPIGLALGVLGQKAGLAPWQVGLMSVIVFAGSAQFIAVGMLAAGASLAAIVATTFMVNLRHLLMSSALAPYFAGSSRRFLALFAYGVTDESFSIHAVRFRQGGWDPWRALLLNQTANATWVVSTLVGAHVGQLIPPGAWGVDYALTAMFLCLLVFQVRKPLHLVTGGFAAVLSVALYLGLPGNGHVILATVLAASAGFALTRYRRWGLEVSR